MNPSDSVPRRRQGMDYGESEDVQKVHAAIQREKQEPRVGLEPLSLWLIGIYALAIFFGGAYLGRFSGSFSGDSLDPGTVPTKSHGAGPGGGGQQQTAELSPAERGKKVFMANCAVCHQASGLGSQSQGYPPLAGSEITNGGSRRAAMVGSCSVKRCPRAGGIVGDHSADGCARTSRHIRPETKTVRFQKSV